MSIRSILVEVAGNGTDRRRLEAALWCARSLDAHLTGLHVMEPVIATALSHHPGIAMGTPEAFEMERRLKRRREENRRRARECEHHFRRLASGDDVEASWKLATGDLVTTLEQHALYADMVVVGQPDGGRGGLAADDGLADQVVVRIGCPLLVVPVADRSPFAVERIVVAWHCDAQASRTLHAALPLLSTAREVEVVTVNGRTRGLEDGIPMERAVRGYLARHGIASEFRWIPSNGRIGQTLLSHVSERGADLVVMGAYHHSRLREALLGGVTRHVLRNAAVPVLIAH